MASSSTDSALYRFRPVEEASDSFLSAVGSMTRGERPTDVDYLLRLADMVLEVHDRCQVSAKRPSEVPEVKG